MGDLNKFNPTNRKGTSQTTGVELACQVDSASVAQIEAGDFVKLVGNSRGRLLVELCADGEEALGMVKFQSKKDLYVADDMLTVTRDNGLVYAVASAAVVIGADVEVSGAGKKVATINLGVKVGKAMSAAAADGDLILIEPQKV